MMIEKIKTYRFNDVQEAQAIANSLIENDYFCRLEIANNQILMHLYRGTE